MATSTHLPSVSAVNPSAALPDARLRWVEHVARLMDSQFQLPGTKFRFGLDPLLGLIPIVGDLSTFAVSAILVLTMMRHGASRNVKIRMVLNIFIDSVLGAIPLIGNVFDFAWKANDRNVALLRKHYQAGKHQGSGTGLLIVVFLVLFLLLGLISWGIWSLIMYFWQYGQAHWTA